MSEEQLANFIEVVARTTLDSGGQEPQVGRFNDWRTKNHNCKKPSLFSERMYTTGYGW